MKNSFRSVSAVFSAVVFAVLLAVIVAPSPAQAVEWAPYTRASFVKAQEAGKTIIVAVHASW